MTSEKSATKISQKDISLKRKHSKDDIDEIDNKDICKTIISEKNVIDPIIKQIDSFNKLIFPKTPLTNQDFFKIFDEWKLCIRKFSDILLKQIRCNKEKYEFCNKMGLYDIINICKKTYSNLKTNSTNDNVFNNVTIINEIKTCLSLPSSILRMADILKKNEYVYKQLEYSIIKLEKYRTTINIKDDPFWIMKTDFVNNHIILEKIKLKIIYEHLIFVTHIHNNDKIISILSTVTTI